MAERQYASLTHFPMQRDENNLRACRRRLQERENDFRSESLFFFFFFSFAQSIFAVGKRNRNRTELRRRGRRSMHVQTKTLKFILGHLVDVA